MPRYLDPQDSDLLRDFTTRWQAAGWGAFADCQLEVPYGHPYKFFGSLFLPKDYNERFSKIEAKQLLKYQEDRFAVFDASHPPEDPDASSLFDYEVTRSFPNFVTSPSAAGVCYGAICRAIELYPGAIPTPEQLEEQVAETEVGQEDPGLSARALGARGLLGTGSFLGSGQNSPLF